MAKSAKARAQGAPRTRRPKRDDSDRLSHLLIIGGVIAVVLIAAGVIGFGYWATEIKPKGDTVLTVGSLEFTRGHVERRLSQELPDDPLTAGRDVLVYPEQVILQLQREGLLIEGAEELGVEVTDEDIAVQIRQLGGLAEDAEPALYATEFKRQVDESGLHDGEYRQQVRADLLDRRVRDYFTFLAPNNEAQVRGRWIRTDSQENADAALLRLAAGEDFSDVATALSLDSFGATAEADLDWTLRGAFGLIPRSLEDYLFTGEVGVIGDVIQDENVYYIPQIIERDDDRALTEQQRTQAGIRDMNQWLEDLPNRILVVRNFDDNDALEALDDVGVF